MYLSSLPHAVRDFASSLKFAEKGIAFADFLQSEFPDTRGNVAPVLHQLRGLKETTLRCMGNREAEGSGKVRSMSTSGGNVKRKSAGAQNVAADDDDDDDSFRRLVGVGDSLTLDERVNRAIESGDDLKALKALRQATEYFVSLGRC